jgi:glycosyltransferase involved in cell wall biosynthesis
VQKAWGVIKGFLRRTKAMLMDVPQYDYIFIHREASPIGPPIFEFIISKIWRKKIIYDFDDAIWIPNTTNENKIVGWLKAFWKIKYICRWSYKVVGGNDFLCNYARQYNKAVILIPTCVDVAQQHNQLKNQQTGKVVVGWTGSHSTMKYLDDIVPVLKRLVKEFDIEVLIISNKAPHFTIPNLQFIPWKEDTEVNDLLQLNIGLMPLHNEVWSEGKCGFKLIQYLALGIPAVAHPVGVNKEIIQEGITGFLCATEEQWYHSLKHLITKEEFRKQAGVKGRASIVEKYSIQSYRDIFINLFK